MSTNDALAEDINYFLRLTVQFGRREVIAYGNWLYGLTDTGFKTAGDVLFQTARKGRRTGDWDPLPSLRYWHRAFTNEYRAVQAQRIRRAAR